MVHVESWGQSHASMCRAYPWRCMPQVHTIPIGHLLSAVGICRSCSFAGCLEHLRSRHRSNHVRTRRRRGRVTRGGDNKAVLHVWNTFVNTSRWFNVYWYACMSAMKQNLYHITTHVHEKNYNTTRYRTMPVHKDGGTISTSPESACVVRKIRMFVVWKGMLAAFTFCTPPQKQEHVIRHAKRYHVLDAKWKHTLVAFGYCSHLQD